MLLAASRVIRQISTVPVKEMATKALPASEFSIAYVTVPSEDVAKTMVKGLLEARLAGKLVFWSSHVV